MLTTGRQINEVHKGAVVRAARGNVTAVEAAWLPLGMHCISTDVACSSAVFRWESSNTNQEI